MSSLSRRACFKCGNVGHYAGEPSFARLVENTAAAVVARRRALRFLRRAGTSGATSPGNTELT